MGKNQYDRDSSNYSCKTERRKPQKTKLIIKDYKYAKEKKSRCAEDIVEVATIHRVATRNLDKKRTHS